MFYKFHGYDNVASVKYVNVNCGTNAHSALPTFSNKMAPSPFLFFLSRYYY